jgi:hypothetical protein
LPCRNGFPAGGVLVEPQNQGRRFVSGLSSKPLGGFLHFVLKTDGNSFLVEPQNQGGGGFPSWGLKTGSYDLVIWASKSPRRFLGLGLKTKQTLICRLRHKTEGRCDGVGHALRSSGLLHMEASLARVSQSGLKTGGGATADSARGTIAEVVSESS